jgi:hypothetical protein
MSTLQQLASFVIVDLHILKTVLQGTTVEREVTRPLSVSWALTALLVQKNLGNTNSSNCPTCHDCDGQRFSSNCFAGYMYPANSKSS